MTGACIILMEPKRLKNLLGFIGISGLLQMTCREPASKTQDSPFDPKTAEPMIIPLWDRGLRNGYAG